MALDLTTLLNAMTGAGQGLAGTLWSQIQTVALPELQKIATQVVAIETNLLAVPPTYTRAGAQYLFDMQVRASISVIAGMTALTVIDIQNAINQILAAVKAMINGAVGFALVA
jgi:hypothetical protein